MTDIKVVIPANNEEQSISLVVRDIPKDLVSEVVVVNNASTDQTSRVAAAAGATVLDEPAPGYGNACLRGIRYLDQEGKRPDILVFLDGDYSDYPQEMEQVVAPVLKDGMDLVIGSRTLGRRARGSMTFPQVFGNWLATTLMWLFYGVRFTDLGPFRAIRFDKLLEIKMADQTYGWTVEMQVKAARHRLKITEVPVNYKKRIGISKVSGTIKGTVMAGYKILWTIFKYL